MGARDARKGFFASANGHRVAGAAARAGLAILLLAGAAAIGRPAWAQTGAEVVTPQGDPARGRTLFVRKACVVCHSVNGIGGAMAPSLDADPGVREIDVADFAARMWRGAGPMVWLQNYELGYQIDLTGDDITHLAAFAADAAEQANFAENQVPGRILELLLTEPYVRPEDWQWETEPE